MQSQNTTSMLDRVVRALRLDTSLYEEAEHDASLTGEALRVVIFVAIIAGAGNFIDQLLAFKFGSAFGALFATIIGMVVGYYIWSYVTWFVGSKFMGGTADVGELKRTLGYAFAPQALSFFAFIPCIGGIVALAGAIWALVAGVVAVRQALDFTTGKAVITVIIGWVFVMILALIIAAIFGIGGAGLGMMTG